MTITKAPFVTSHALEPPKAVQSDMIVRKNAGLDCEPTQALKGFLAFLNAAEPFSTPPLSLHDDTNIQNFSASCQEAKSTRGRCRNTGVLKTNTAMHPLVPHTHPKEDSGRTHCTHSNSTLYRFPDPAQFLLQLPRAPFRYTAFASFALSCFLLAAL